MANFRRKKPRHRTSSRYSTRVGNKRFSHIHPCWMYWYPAWHDILFHRRPHRRATKEVEGKLLRGADPDDLVWPVSKKPHVYYW